MLQILCCLKENSNMSTNRSLEQPCLSTLLLSSLVSSVNVAHYYYHRLTEDINICLHSLSQYRPLYPTCCFLHSIDIWFKKHQRKICSVAKYRSEPDSAKRNFHYPFAFENVSSTGTITYFLCTGIYIYIYHLNKKCTLQLIS